MRKIVAVILTLAMYGCGSAYVQQANTAISAPKYTADISGAYVFTMNGYWSGTPIYFTASLTQNQWFNGINLLSVTGSVSGLCARQDIQGMTGNLRYGPPETLHISIDSGTGNVLVIDSEDFSKMSGTWSGGPALPNCGLEGTAGTWTAAKQ